MRSILIIDDEMSIRESLRMIFKNDFHVLLAQNGKEAKEILEKEDLDIVLLDLLIPDIGGMEILKEIKNRGNKPLVIVITAVRSIKTAVEAMKLGAFDYITKPFDIEEVRVVVRKALNTIALSEEVDFLRGEVYKKFAMDNLIGRSSKMREIFSLIKRIAETDSTVLITGESGTGKELVSRAIHYHSKRKNAPFIPVHCASIPENLLESELFGYEKGAFTGAVSSKPGRFVLADGGTLFLDEIGDMPLNLQTKLLRVLEEKEFIPVGGTRSRKVDVRFIAATNRDLEKLVKDGKFREDLFYRINVVPIHLPPLRERKEDIPILAGFFLDKYSKEMGAPPKKLSPEALELLLRYNWPGNVRELENTMERVVVLFRDVSEVKPEHLPQNMRGVGDTATTSSSLSSPSISPSLEELTLEEAINHIQREMILRALEKAGGVQTKAAEILGTTRRILRYKMEKLGIKYQESND